MSQSSQQDMLSSPAVYQSLTQGKEMIKSAIEELRKKVLEYDAQSFGVAEKAGPLLNSAIQKAQDALGELSQMTEGLRNGHGELPVRGLTAVLAKINGAFTSISELAHDYDQRFKLSATLSSVITSPKEQATAAIVTMATHLSAVATHLSAQLQGFSDGLRTRLISACNAGMDAGMPAAVKADELLHVSSRGSVVVERIKELDVKLGVSDYVAAATAPIQSLDQKATGGRLSKLFVAAYNVGWNMVGTVQEKFEETKRKMNS